jgi:hypothetical protein
MAHIVFLITDFHTIAEQSIIRTAIGSRLTHSFHTRLNTGTEESVITVSVIKTLYTNILIFITGEIW